MASMLSWLVLALSSCATLLASPINADAMTVSAQDCLVSRGGGIFDLCPLLRRAELISRSEFSAAGVTTCLDGTATCRAEDDAGIVIMSSPSPKTTLSGEFGTNAALTLRFADDVNVHFNLECGDRDILSPPTRHTSSTSYTLTWITPHACPLAPSVNFTANDVQTATGSREWHRPTRTQHASTHTHATPAPSTTHAADTKDGEGDDLLSHPLPDEQKKTRNVVGMFAVAALVVLSVGYLLYSPPTRLQRLLSPLLQRLPSSIRPKFRPRPTSDRLVRWADEDLNALNASGSDDSGSFVNATSDDESEEELDLGRERIPLKPSPRKGRGWSEVGYGAASASTGGR